MTYLAPVRKGFQVIHGTDEVQAAGQSPLDRADAASCEMLYECNDVGDPIEDKVAV